MASKWTKVCQDNLSKGILKVALNQGKRPRKCPPVNRKPRRCFWRENWPEAVAQMKVAQERRRTSLLRARVIELLLLTEHCARYIQYLTECSNSPIVISILQMRKWNIRGQATCLKLRYRSKPQYELIIWKAKSLSSCQSCHKSEERKRICLHICKLIRYKLPRH